MITHNKTTRGGNIKIKIVKKTNGRKSKRKSIPTKKYTQDNDIIFQQAIEDISNHIRDVENKDNKIICRQEVIPMVVTHFQNKTLIGTIITFCVLVVLGIGLIFLQSHPPKSIFTPIINKQPTSICNQMKEFGLNYMLKEYIVIKGDTLWNISYKNYGDYRLWPLIWQINKCHIYDMGLSNIIKGNDEFHNKWVDCAVDIKNPDLLGQCKILWVPKITKQIKSTDSISNIIQDLYYDYYLNIQGKRKDDIGFLWLAWNYNHDRLLTLITNNSISIKDYNDMVSGRR